MSKIVIEVSDYKDLTGTISVIQKITKKGISEIKNNITAHRPVYEGALFYNDHDEVADKLIALVRDLAKINTQVAVYELDEDDDASDLSKYEDSLISPMIMLNIIQKHDDEIERQQSL